MNCKQTLLFSTQILIRDKPFRLNFATIAFLINPVKTINTKFLMKIRLFYKKMGLILIALFLSIPHLCFAQKKTIAITIDDLPFVGDYRNFHLNMIIDSMKTLRIPITGFIIASEVRNDSWETLQKFRDAGFGLGNHTFSHANLNKVKSKKYIQEINRADKILLPVLTEPKYFRYPYLAMSSGRKKDKILCHLSKKNYHIAPITVDSKDFYFNQRLLSVPELDRRNYLNELKTFYLDFIWQQTLKAEEHDQFNHQAKQSQILLIHANLLNAYVLPDIIKLYKRKGYTFVTLEDALKTFKKTTQCSKPNANHINESYMPSIKTEKNDTTIEAFVDWD